MSSVAELLERESETVDLERDHFERLIRRRDRTQLKRRIGAGALALVVSLLAIALLVRAFQSELRPANRRIEPTPSQRVGFVGLPPQGAHASTPPSGEMVLSLNGSGVDLYVYADGTMIWQKWSSSSVEVGVPEGANRFTTGYLEQRLTTEGVELLRSRILATGLFEHDLDLRLRSHHHRSHHRELTIGVRKGDRVVLVSAFKAPDEKAIARETPAQARALVRLESLLADPAAWLPTTGWADREISAYVAARYSGGFDLGVPSPSELPPPAAELLFGRRNCRDFTIEEVRTISTALENAGINPSLAPNGELGFFIADPQSERSGESYLHFWPVLPDRSTFQGWTEGVPPTC
jgi:hypothetical protein